MRLRFDQRACQRRRTCAVFVTTYIIVSYASKLGARSACVTGNGSSVGRHNPVVPVMCRQGRRTGGDVSDGQPAPPPSGVVGVRAMHDAAQHAHTHTCMQHHTHSAVRGVRGTIGSRCGSVWRTRIAPCVFRAHTKCTTQRTNGSGAPRVVHGHVACSRWAARKYTRAHAHTHARHMGTYRMGGYQNYDHHRHHSFCRQAGAPRLRIRSTAVSAAAAITSGAMAAGHNHRHTGVTRAAWAQPCARTHLILARTGGRAPAASRAAPSCACRAAPATGHGRLFEAMVPPSCMCHGPPIP
eukprot:COSAG01_NODE_2003_length_8671_cov_9.134858_4_plen_297_part_00